MSDHSYDMRPLLGDLTEQPPEAIVRLGGRDQAVPYEKGDTRRFANLTEDASWAHKLRISLV